MSTQISTESVGQMLLRYATRRDRDLHTCITLASLHLTNQPGDVFTIAQVEEVIDGYYPEGTCRPTKAGIANALAVVEFLGIEKVPEGFRLR